MQLATDYGPLTTDNRTTNGQRQGQSKKKKTAGTKYRDKRGKGVFVLVFGIAVRGKSKEQRKEDSN